VTAARQNWPALSGFRADGQSLRCQLGVWGKVHGAASDYRWIARSPELAKEHPWLERQLRAGLEDQAVHATHWRALGGHYFAVSIYPSRAFDAANRSGFLEKQILGWSSGREPVPAAAAALLLLPRVAALDTQVWWTRLSEGDWGRPDYYLPIDSGGLPPVDVAETELERAIEQGIAELNAAATSEQLRAVYAALLGGERPARLEGLKEPLSPHALAALLLPLPRSMADALSMAGWVPSTLIDPRDLAANWDLFVTHRHSDQRTPVPPPTSRPGRMAEALRTADPSPLTAGSIEASAGSSQDTGRRPADPSSARSRRRASVAPRASAPVPAHPNPLIAITPAPAGAHPILTELQRFAEQSNRRRLDLANIARLLRREAGLPRLHRGTQPQEHPLCRWVDEVERQCPDWAHPDEWAMKIDQLRAAALFLLPHPKTAELVGLPRSGAVPALLMGFACPPEIAGDAFAEHGEKSLKRIFDHSLNFPARTLRQPLSTWIERWLGTISDRALAHQLSRTGA